MFSVLALALTGSATLITPEVGNAFHNFQQKYGKRYEHAEEFAQRMEIFAQNLKKVDLQNAENVAAGGDACFGVTQFMDLTPEEFQSTYLTYIPSTLNTTKTVLEPLAAPLTMVDWVASGDTTPVKDQGQCGSCWAFSAVEAIESYGKLSGTYGLYTLSPQQVVSCDKVDGGCNGGNTETAYNYIKGAGGLETATSYPYTSGTTGSNGVCKFNAANVKVQIRGYTSVAKGETQLTTALNAGPVSVCVAANAFQTYTSGVLAFCPGFIDHCVQAVGYDNGASTPYWRVRNSWGTSWGEKGYIRLKIGNNPCKIQNDVTYPNF